MKHLTIAAMLVAMAACGQADVPAAGSPADSDGTAGEVARSELAFENATLRMPLDGRDVSAAFMTVRGTDTPLRIVGASAAFAETVELHTHMMVEGRMAMRRVEGLDVPANGELTLKPGGDHIMLFGVDSTALVVGESAEIVLTVEDPEGNQREVTAVFEVTSLD